MNLNTGIADMALHNSPQFLTDSLVSTMSSQARAALTIIRKLGTDFSQNHWGLLRNELRRIRHVDHSSFCRIDLVGQVSADKDRVAIFICNLDVLNIHGLPCSRYHL